MRVVVLGGTGLLSRPVVAAALARGHEVTTVTRGTSGPPPDGARALHADRDDAEALTALLAPELFDAVVDTSCYSVAGAHAAARALVDVPRYVHVGSISAYRDWPPGPVRSEADPTWGPDADLDDYGPMKAESERVLGRVFGDGLLVVRAGLLVGPGDRTRRLTSWLDRIAHHDRVVVPADTQDQPIAVVDVRDLAEWVVTALQEPWSGPVTATGPQGMTTYGGLLRACRAAVGRTGGRPAALVPVGDAALLAAAVEPWRDLPFWLPADVAATAWDVATDRAESLGLRTRPVEESVLDAWRWVQDVGLDHPPLPARLDPARFDDVVADGADGGGPSPQARAAQLLVRGRVEHLPRRRSDRDLLLRYVATRVVGVHDPVEERELTDRLAGLSRDPVGLRRELVDAGILTRTRDGSEYWRTHVTEFDGL